MSRETINKDQSGLKSSKQPDNQNVSIQTNKEKDQVKQEQIHQINQNSIKQEQQIAKQQEIINVQTIKVQEEQPQEQRLIQVNNLLAQQHKRSGNQNFGNKRYNQCLNNYRSSLRLISRQSSTQSLRSILYSNMGLTYLKLQQYQQAKNYLLRSLKLNQNYRKARINLAICYQKLEKVEQAYQQYKKVLEKGQADAFVRGKLQQLQQQVKKIQEKRKEQVISGLKNIGNSVLGFFGMSLDNFKLEQGPTGGYNVSYKN